MSYENRKKEYDRLMAAGRKEDIPDVLEKEFGKPPKEKKKPEEEGATSGTPDEPTDAEIEAAEKDTEKLIAKKKAAAAKQAKLK